MFTTKHHTMYKQPPEVFCKKGVSQNSQENNCARVSFLIKLQAQVLVCEFCEISKNTFFTKHVWATASDYVTLIAKENLGKIVKCLKIL